jgi:hypothetical protein
VSKNDIWKNSRLARDYQSQAVEVLARSKGLLLDGGVGLGKTYTAVERWAAEIAHGGHGT